MIRLDLSAGRVPFMVAATAGTTNAGMIDPLVACAEIARSSNLWYHVDAAWGGGLIASDKLKERLAGIELADSVTIDAHKWFATTMGCGMLITRWPALLSAAFHVAADFMPSNTAAVDPYVTSMQWSRRFLGLRLFLSLAVAGWSGHGKHVERSVAMAHLLKEQLITCGWGALNEPLVGVLCIIPPKPRAIRLIVQHVLASGRAWISVATTEGREVIRVCVTSGMTTTEDIADLVAALLQAADKTHYQLEQTRG
jgi:aromatic-L-amino-acid/L-tryptophan decarboxylase